MESAEQVRTPSLAQRSYLNQSVAGRLKNSASGTPPPPISQALRRWLDEMPCPTLSPLGPEVNITQWLSNITQWLSNIVALRLPPALAN
jgi:hypothetical protein